MLYSILFTSCLTGVFVALLFEEIKKNNIDNAYKKLGMG